MFVYLQLTKKKSPSVHIELQNTNAYNFSSGAQKTSQADSETFNQMNLKRIQNICVHHAVFRQRELRVCCFLLVHDVIKTSGFLLISSIVFRCLIVLLACPLSATSFFQHKLMKCVTCLLRSCTHGMETSLSRRNIYNQVILVPGVQCNPPERTKTPFVTEAWANKHTRLRFSSG